MRAVVIVLLAVVGCTHAGQPALPVTLDDADGEAVDGEDAGVSAGAVLDPFAATARCSSAQIRSATESEGPDMMPGYACISCHADSNAATGDDAPIFGFAGTLYPSGHEPDGCVSPDAEGAEVLVTDATGKTFTVVAQASGNFFFDEGSIAPPFRARVRFEGREREMVLSQTNTDCNACHTATGENGAPGRIVLP